MTEKKTNNDHPTAGNQSDAAAAAKDNPKNADNQSKASGRTAQEPTKRAPAKSGSGSKTGLVAIALVILLGGGLYYHGHQQNLAQQAQLAALTSQLNEMKNALSQSEQSVKAAVQESLDSAATRLSQQENDIQGLQRSMTEIQGRRPNDWLLAEADYLTRMAGRKLSLEHDVASATLLLESADNRIAQLSDPSLTELRKALSNDITMLKSIARIDRDGLVLRLTSLQTQIDSLPLANAIVPESLDQPQTESVSESISDWKSNLMTSLKQFGGHFVTYRKRDGNVIPLLSPEQDFYLQENIKSKLETAIKAVYREQGELYTTSLTMAKDWASQFYKTDDAKTQSFIQALDELAQQKIEVNYPKILTSQSMLLDTINMRMRQQVAPIHSEEDPA
ncbi:uroporphyrinogen-III C-methyltransferase [Photobacterium galatheae]|uniref:Uroporphyrin-III methyltransferase n=1 Tax=Photobacterium galatheae TaxID=1654360 RepID=A0A066RNU0_9GAMM|nr:uroporphyrinogen-III C-methyltransferase [Photobacterium galatheae]KDM92115.1 uroporphyrin-III methyltransferase [Photobacterium galatheae]MCM0150960.1 uroporphyrinogen-III C-methyltransferase [Photobacterium galatheae]